jgi:hypothetical protein
VKHSKDSVSKFAFLLVMVLLAVEFFAINFAYTNKTKNSYSALTRITSPNLTDSLGNVIFKP